MKLRYIIMCCLLVCCYFNLLAQERTGKEMQIELDTTTLSSQLIANKENSNFQLPPLQILFEAAKKNPRIEAIQAAIEAAKCDVKSVKRDWFSFFSLRAGFNYGILGTYTDQETQYTPLTTVYSGSTQSSWSIGANIGIPLNVIANHRNSVKKQQYLVENAKYSQDIVFNEIKMEIVELYSNIQFQLKTLMVTSEALTLAIANYNVAQKDFINNRVTPDKLAELKGNQKRIYTEYELTLANINIYLLKLEILTNTKLTNK